MSDIVEVAKASGWDVRIGGTVIRASGPEIEALAKALSFRLSALSVDRIGSGIGARVGPDQYIHLCFGDEIDDLIQRLRELRDEDRK